MRKNSRFARLLCLLSITASLALSASAQDFYTPLPQDSGAAGLEQILRRLRTTARLIHTAAHPDDEDGGMLVLQSRGRGVTALQVTLNRGEGGQNKMGSNLLDELGILRTLELLAADRYYAVEQRFARVADFGYSKSAHETFEKWGGHEPALADLVRVIREFRPDVIVSRFQGTPRDGHGQHEAAGILTREAFHAAADPKRFPEQIREGLQPWQAKKLYIDNVRPPQESTLKLDTGARDPLLGTSCIQFGMQGLKHQLSQGAGAWQVPPGPHFSYYRLVESVLPKSETPETDFFDGIDTSLPGLARRLGRQHSLLLGSSLQEAAREIEEAASWVHRGQLQQAAKLFLSARKRIVEITRTSELAMLSPAAKADVLTQLRTKQEQLEQAANLALGLELKATVYTAAPVAVAGQLYRATIGLSNANQLRIRSLAVDAPAAWLRNKPKDRPSDATGVATFWEAGNPQAQQKFNFEVPPDAAYTRPYWHRDNAQKQTIYSIDAQADGTLPFAPLPLHARAVYELDGLEGVIVAPVMMKTGTGKTVPFAVGPPFSVAIEPAMQVLRMGGEMSAVVNVSVRAAGGPASGTLVLHAPPGWTVEPKSQPVNFAHGSSATSFPFKVSHAVVPEGRYELRAELDIGARRYAESYSEITRDDLGAAYFYRPAVQRVSVVDVKTAAGLKIGYIMGAGDEIPAVLKQIGMDVELITPEQLATGDLRRFGAIVLGIRAYDTREDVRTQNPRLLDYVSAGGTLVVQYNTDLRAFNSGQFTPYPADLGRERVTVEEAPVEILAPQDDLFNFPNPISARDFSGWVQERGLYFMSQWDSHFEPLLASHDPGEAPLMGGLLRARFGKGTYIYTGYAFFRQLPAGVPGAIRLFVNLVSAGQEPHSPRINADERR